ncbi:MAG TPA: hypothetical protein VNW92_29510 [Polyangiaceae bacterium]|nr:hypothetical protein [Polyangiaceae bacterium]
MLLTKRKNAARRLLNAVKAERDASRTVAPRDAALDHEKQLAVVDAVEWAVERWASRDRVEPITVDPRAAHAAHLIAALAYLDSRFQRLDGAFVTQLIEAVAAAPPEAQDGPRLDAKAAAALLTVEVGAFRR